MTTKITATAGTQGLANGGNCTTSPSVVIGQVCFSDSPAHTGKYGEGHQLAGHNLLGIFKVVI